MSKSKPDDHHPRIGVIVHTEKTLGGGLEELRAYLAEHGHADPPWYEIDKSKQAPKKVRKLIEDDGVDRLVVWGGDGTVRRCIDAVMQERSGDKVAIGILPAGTANLLANNLDIPLELEPAVENAVKGEVRPIDLGLINDDEYFAVMAGAGFDAMLIADADESGAKDRWGRLGYVMAGARNTKIKPAEAIVTVDGDLWYQGPAASVIAGNVGSLFGGLCAFPNAVPFDGRLDVGVAAARSRRDWMRLFGSALVHRIEGSPFVEQTSGEKILVELDRTLPWQTDGGSGGRTDRFEITCVPHAIGICRPRLTDSEDES